MLKRAYIRWVVALSTCQREENQQIVECWIIIIIIFNELWTEILLILPLRVSLLMQRTHMKQSAWRSDMTKDFFLSLYLNVAHHTQLRSSRMYQILYITRYFPFAFRDSRGSLEGVTNREVEARKGRLWEMLFPCCMTYFHCSYI